MQQPPVPPHQPLGAAPIISVPPTVGELAQLDNFMNMLKHEHKAGHINNLNYGNWLLYEAHVKAGMVRALQGAPVNAPPWILPLYVQLGQIQNDVVHLQNDVASMFAPNGPGTLAINIVNEKVLNSAVTREYD
jgi:hypothetical protein